MDKVIKDQILGSFAKYNFDQKNFIFHHIKDHIYKLSYNNKYITYIDIGDGTSGGQRMNWKTSRRQPGEYIKKIVDAEKTNDPNKELIYDVVCLVNIIDGPGILSKCIEGLNRQTKESTIVLIVKNHDERQWAIDNNVDHFWTNEKGNYEKFCSGANYIRATYREVKNMMICNSNDFFPENWVYESYNLIKKKHYSYVGSKKLYVYDRDSLFDVDINQEYAKTVITNNNWDDVCFYNGLVISRSILNPIDWVIGSGNFNNNISFGIYNQLMAKKPKICYMDGRSIVTVNTDKSQIYIREFKTNKCLNINKIDALPYINSTILKQMNIPIRETGNLTVTSPRINIPDKEDITSAKSTNLMQLSKTSHTVRDGESLHKVDIPQVKKVEIPLIMLKKPKPESPKTNKRRIIPPTRTLKIGELDEEQLKIREEEEKKRKHIEEVKRKQKEQELAARKKREIELKKKIEYQLKSHTKIMTIILHRNNQNILDSCIKALTNQLLQTDIIVVTSNKGIIPYLESIGIYFLLTDNKLDDKQDILDGLTSIRKINPLFVSIIYDNDILAPDWIREMHAHMKKNDYDVIGKNNGFVYEKVKEDDKNKRKREPNLYVKTPKLSQLTHIPIEFRKKWSIMNGKLIYNRILHKVDWNIFLNNKDIDIDTSFMKKLIDNGAKFGRIKRSNILTVVDNEAQKNKISRSYLDVENVKTAEHIPMNDLYNIKTIFGELLVDYNIDFTRKEKTKHKMIEIPEIVTNLSYVYDNNILCTGYNELDMKEDIFTDLDESNRVVEGLWIGENLGIFEQLCIISFMRKGHIFHLYTYGNLKGVPKGCVIKNASDILPKEEIFYYSEHQSLSGKRTPVAFSNMFRYKMLYDNGGYWVDMDMICRKPFNFKESYVFSSERDGNGNQVVNAGVLKCPVKSEFALYCYNVCLQKDKTTIKWGEIGPALVNDGINHYGLGKFVKPPDAFCPIDINQINTILDPYSATMEKSWYSIHLWNEIWRKQGTDKNLISFSFIAEVLFGVKIERIFNKAGVFINWLPLDQMISTFTQGKEEKIFDCPGRADIDQLNMFIDNDIYVNLMKKLLEKNLISEIHIIMATKKDERDNYSNKFTMFSGIYYKHRNIHFWRIHNLSDLTFIRNATFIFNRGRYDKLYRHLDFDSSTTFIANYPATSMNQIIVDGKIVDDNQSYRSSFPYDIMFIDETEKIQDYRAMYPKTNNFVNLHKHGLSGANITNTRPYDIVYCGSTMYPTKNAGLFLDYLNYLSKNKIHVKICIVSRFDDHMPTFPYIQIEQKNNVSYDTMKTIFSQSRVNLIMSGRDANPRVISEALSCGCYCICLDTMSDGYSLFKEKPVLGSRIPTVGKYLAENSSACCKPNDELFDRITNEIYEKRDARVIAETFNQYFNKKYDQQISKIIDIYRKSNKGTYILTLATEDYTKPLNYLLSSIRHSNPTLTVVAILVNCRDKLVQDFSDHYPRYRFINYKISPDYRKGTILKLKVKFQRYFFKKYEKPFIWIDADSIVLKSLNKLLYNLWEYNMMVYTRFNDENDFMKFAVGVIGFGMGKDIEATKNLLDAYYDEVQVTKGVNNWFYDQTALWDVYQNIKQTLKLFELKETDHTLDCNNNSTIVSRRRKKETAIKYMLEKSCCVIANINFDAIPTMYEY
jgi:hypothetical protein